MRRLSILLGVATLVFFMTYNAYAGLNQFSGKWQNVDKNTRGVTALDISIRGTQVMVQAWGKCHPTDCDWGKTRGLGYAPNVSASLAKKANALSVIFKKDFKESLMIIKPKGKGLRVEIYTHFTKGNRSAYRSVDVFRKVKPVKPVWPGKPPVGEIKPAPGVQEDCVSFNNKTIAVKKINGRWKIVDGSHWIFDFGEKEKEARQAFAIIKKYKYTKSCFVGRPDPSFQYMR